MKHGMFCWLDVTTPDAAAAKKFYGELFGWRTKEEKPGPHPYTMFTLDGKEFGGLMPMTGPEWQGVPPHMMVYIAVDDINAAAAKVTQLGGKVCVPPTDIGVGWFSVVSDPTGVTFSLYQSKGPS
jgi:uncharacterized protein